MLSLANVLPNHGYYREAVVNNKQEFLSRMKQWVDLPPQNQPLLCTRTNVVITSNQPNVVLYAPRGLNTGSVVCHLGEIQLGTDARGTIFDSLSVTHEHSEGVA